MVFLLGLFLINGQSAAQKAPVAEVTKIDFGTGPEAYLTTKPDGYNFGAFNYATSVNMADNKGEYIFTKDPDDNGNQWGETREDNTGGGYFVYAVRDNTNASDLEFYSIDVDVTAGETIEFGIYFLSLNNKYRFRINARGNTLDAANNPMQIKTSEVFESFKESWVLYSLSIVAPRTETVTFSIITEKMDWGNDAYRFGIDDVTISRSVLRLTSLASLATVAKTGESVLLQAEYDYPAQSGNPSYRWEKSEDGKNWNPVSGTLTTAGSSSFTTDPFYATEANEKYVYYRLAFSYNNFGTTAFYSSTVTIDFRSDKYIFKEDFGGNMVSTASTDPSGASGDWWIMPGSEPSITTDYSYGESYNWDKIENAYGQMPLRVNNAGDYVITKLSGVKNYGIPGYSDVNEGWSYGGDCCYDDHTFPGDSTKGYFMNSLTESSTYKTVYAVTVPVTTEMKGQGFALSTWQACIYGLEGSDQIQLQVEDNNGSAIKSGYFSLSSGWDERELLFYIPDNYAGNTITLRVSVKGGHLRLGIDDISLAKYETNVAITSPQSGSSVGSNVNFTVDYEYVSSSINYKWQESTTGTGGWTDISGSEGTATGTAGTFTAGVCPIEDGSYYRVLITDSNDANFTEAIASDPVRLTRADYLFKEDFGGTTQSTDTSKDWWITESKATADNIPNVYNSDYPYAPDASWIDAGDITNHPYGMEQTLFLYSDRFAITKVSGKMADLDYSGGSARPVMIDNQKTLYDYTTGNGTGYYMMSRGWDAGKILYSHTLGCVAEGSYSFNVWLASTSASMENKANLTLQVKVGSSTFTETVDITTQDWTEYSVPLYTDGSSPIEISIISGTGHLGSATFGVDDISLTYLSPRITNPDISEINILTGRSITLEGQYKYISALGTAVTYRWETSTDGTAWASTGASGSIPNANNADNAIIVPPYTTGAITATTYFRLMIESNGITLESGSVKITPADMPTSKTYWVCPDNMSDNEALIAKGDENSYMPGMASLGEKGYLPSLISMEVTEVYNIIYKWYDSETGTTPLTDKDTYKGDVRYPSADMVQDPTFESDLKTNTMSVQNERNTEGIFNDRTYWVEICDNNGNPYPDINRIPIYLKQSFLCGSLDAVVSPVNSRRLHRENFGGTSDSDPKIKQTPPQGFIIDYDQHTLDDDNVPEGAYLITKQSPTLNGNGWVSIKDHIYEGLANEKHGYSVVINATEKPGRFYTYQMNNLGSCRNIELVFSGWFASPMGWNGYEKANLKFILTDTDKGTVLAEFLSGNLIDSENKWRQFGFKFYVPEGVTRISMEVVNNNYGTAGGNDVLMDDIEIYLVIPPVTLVPSHDSYVCQIDEDKKYGSVTLSGTYFDDGTLSNYFNNEGVLSEKLDFRWEFKADGSDQWVSIGAQKVDGTSIDAGYGTILARTLLQDSTKFYIENFDQTHNGDYRLVVGQAGAFTGALNYDCLAVSESRNLTFASSAAPYPMPALTDNTTAFCYSDNAGIAVFTNSDSDANLYDSYTWEVDGAGIQNASQGTLNLTLEDYEPGYHTLSLTAFNSVGCSNTSTHNFIIFPKETTWTGKGVKNNWNDLNNWDNGVPGECTNAVIPNKEAAVEGITLLDHYPLLVKPTVETLNEADYATNQANLDRQQMAENSTATFSLRPACDTISFKMGGGVARTDYLKYRFAKADLDILSGRWYTVSAPLRSMYSGDYFIEGNIKRQNPAVYMMKYNATNPQTGDTPELLGGDFSNPFNSLIEDLYPGLGFSIFVNEENNGDTDPKLRSFSLPKDSIEYKMWNYYGTYIKTEYIPERANLGRFTYERLIPMSGYLPATGTADFNVPVKEDDVDYTTTLVGNPFMSHLSFRKFADANGIQDGYYIWTSGKTYQANMPSVFPDDPDEIAPMQSFIIVKKPTSVINNLKFAFDMSVTSSSSNAALRSARSTTTNAVLQIEVLRDNIVHSNIRLKYDPSQNNRYNAQKDMWTLFSNEVTSPAVLYALLDGKAASIRTLGDLSESIELGIRSDTKGVLTLRLSGTDSFDPACDIYLEDKLTGKTYDLRDNPEYTFDNQTGNVQGRLFLRMSSETSGIEDIYPDDSDIHISAYGNQITITASGNDPIESVSIHSLNGKLLYDNRAVRQNSFSFTSPVWQQVVIVTATTNRSQKKEKLIIK